jgi:23S rRNA (adenine2503-C2)-methyltransferase
MATPRTDLRGLSRPELREFVAAQGQPAYRADQLFRWIHRIGLADFEAMSDLGKPLRARLAEVATLAPLAIDLVQESHDGTRKLRMRTHDGAAIESVLIPEGDKLTQCISSQVGCALDCSFCATATLGFGRNLGAGEIVDQVYRARALLPEGQRITNLVFMGMGEPLHNFVEVEKSLALLCDDDGANFSHRKITVSTAGLVPGIEKLGRSKTSPNLAISLNASDDATRDVLMPINKKWPIRALLDAVRAYPLERRRRVTFEYVLLAGVTDRDEDATRLCRLLRGLRCKVNIIPWNPHPAAPYKRPSAERITAFQGLLNDGGLPVYVRRPRGDDIDAACGQLANRAEPTLIQLRT